MISATPTSRHTVARGFRCRTWTNSRGTRVRFSNGYVNSPHCSTSRCGLLTGIYNQRFGHEHNGSQHVAFNAGAKTLAEHLQPSGYATAAFGKRHLGDNGRGGITDTHHSTKHGFKES